MFWLQWRLHNNPSGWFSGKSVLWIILEALIWSISCILEFQATIGHRNATRHFRHWSQDWHLRTHKRRKTKTELKTSFLYVLVRFSLRSNCSFGFFYATINIFPKFRRNFLHSVPHHPGTKVAMVQVDRVSTHSSTLWMLLHRWLYE